MVSSNSKSTPFLLPSEINALPSKEPDLIYSYGSHEKQVVELRLPKDSSEPFPVVLMIHGGCFKERIATRQNTAALVDALRDHGFATFNIEYRCIDTPGGGWPGTFLDIAQAADSLKTLTQTFHLDLNRVVSLGHSAGGTLALWAAARQKISPESPLFLSSPLRIRGAICLGGLGDLRGGTQHLDSICGANTISTLLGEGSESRTLNERLKAASPIEMLPLGLPQVFITGDHDKAAPLEFGDNYVKRAISMGEGELVSQIVIQNCGHHEYNHPGKETFTIILSQIRQILNRSILG